jgi:predicted nucleic acid-binding protein
VSFAVDTNVLLRSIDDGYAAQSMVNDGLIVLRSRGEILFVFPQNLIEFWAVATRPIANNGLGWGVDRAKVELENLKYLFVVLSHTELIFNEWERLVAHHRVAGKQAHDAHLVAAMLGHGVTHLVTFNTNDFKRFNEVTVVSPHNV